MTDLTICAADGCDKPKRANGFCASHNHRNKRYGNPLGGPRGYRAADGEPISWLRAHQNYSGDECLIWPYAKRYMGYGGVNLEDGTYTSPHREMCRVKNGSPPDGLVARHTCGNGAGGCVNPNHMKWGTVEENCADMIEHGTVRRGGKNSNCVLTEEAVMDIRKMRGLVSQVDLAKKHGISQAHVSRIQLGGVWDWLK